MLLNSPPPPFYFYLFLTAPYQRSYGDLWEDSDHRGHPGVHRGERGEGGWLRPLVVVIKSVVDDDDDDDGGVATHTTLHRSDDACGNARVCVCVSASSCDSCKKKMET